ncbi:hypothetical protein JCM33374_g1182 [Metschnikowia sp. JCM 33374]|nr:hypothetical protein JCM33374_g1182 [Metschnikowia sp. JCM 33374]
MLFFNFITFFLASLVIADTTTSSSSSSGSVSASSSSLSTVPPTLVWVTGTDSLGVTKTTQSAYSQKFTSFFASVSVPTSGSVGLGSASGTVGSIRHYSTSVQKNGADGLAAGSSAGVFLTSIVPLLFAILGLL